MSAKNLTDLAIKSAPVGTTWDEAIGGFGIRVGKKTRTFIVLLGSGRRHRIGHYPAVSLADARKEARRLLAERTLGSHQTPYVPYGEAKDAYLAEVAKKNRKSTYAGYKSRLDRLDWGKTNLSDITPRHILAKLATYDSLPMEKRYAFVVLRTFFNWCVAQHKISASPMGNMRPPPTLGSRERVLSSEELKRIWHACPDDAFGRTVKLLILTGQRRGEVAHIELKEGIATIPGAFTKNKRIHSFPMPLEGSKLAQEPLSWSGWGKSKKRLDKAAEVKNWTLHDLRRTYATIHAELGTPPHIIEALLNHQSGTISGVAATYNRYRYLPEMKDAVSRFEAHLATLLQDKQGGTDELSAAGSSGAGPSHEGEGSATTTAPGA